MFYGNCNEKLNYFALYPIPNLFGAGPSLRNVFESPEPFVFI